MKEQEEIADAYCRVFMSEDGRTVFTDLMSTVSIHSVNAKGKMSMLQYIAKKMNESAYLQLDETMKWLEDVDKQLEERIKHSKAVSNDQGYNPDS